MSKFWQLLEQSVIVQGLLTLTFGIAVVYLYIVGKDVPTELLNAFWALIGLWTGGKIENVRARMFAGLRKK